MDERVIQGLAAQASGAAQEDIGVIRGENLTLVIFQNNNLSPRDEQEVAKRLRQAGKDTATHLGIIAFGYQFGDES